MFNLKHLEDIFSDFFFAQVSESFIEDDINSASRLFILYRSEIVEKGFLTDREFVEDTTH
jgi:hypothetical protein